MPAGVDSVLIRETENVPGSTPDVRPELIASSTRAVLRRRGRVHDVFAVRDHRQVAVACSRPSPLIKPLSAKPEEAADAAADAACAADAAEQALGERADRTGKLPSPPLAEDSADIELGHLWGDVLRQFVREPLQSAHASAEVEVEGRDGKLTGSGSVGLHHVADAVAAPLPHDSIAETSRLEALVFGEAFAERKRASKHAAVAKTC